jgi:hypothetical protein
MLSLHLGETEVALARAVVAGRNAVRILRDTESSLCGVALGDSAPKRLLMTTQSCGKRLDIGSRRRNRFCVPLDLSERIPRATQLPICFFALTPPLEALPDRVCRRLCLP